MTTSPRFAYAANLTVSNEIMNFRNDCFNDQSILAGASWTLGGTCSASELVTLAMQLLRLIKQCLPNHRQWLFLGTDAWQPATRIVRHQGLGRIFKAAGIVTSLGGKWKEAIVESDAGLKFFGAMEMTENAMEAGLVQAAMSERCAYIALLPKDADPAELAKVGWIGDLPLDRDLALRVAELDGLVLKRVGAFDDLEKGIVAIGREDLISALPASLQS